MGLFISSELYLNQAIFITSQVTDTTHQELVEQRELKQIVKEGILEKIELAPANSSASLDTILAGFMTQMNSNNNGITIAQFGTSPALPTNAFFPSTGLATISVPSLATAGADYQTAMLIRNGAAKLNLAPLSFTFTRTSSQSSTFNRSYTISADVWSIPLASKYAVIAYGLPATGTGPTAVPTFAPSDTGLLTNAAFTANSGQALTLTTLAPSLDGSGASLYTSGDPTAYDQNVYPEPSGGTPVALATWFSQTTLPRFYRPITSAAWNAWEYIWSDTYMNRLYTEAQAASGAGLYDFDAFTPPTITGVTTVSANSAISVDLSQVTGDCLAITDGAGGCSVTLNGAASNAKGPLVVLVRNTTTGSNSTTVTISGSNLRTTLLYTTNSQVTLPVGASWNGGIWIDQRSTFTGTGSLNGSLAFYGAKTMPSAPILTPASGTIASDLTTLSPRIVVVTLSSSIN